MYSHDGNCVKETLWFQLEDELNLPMAIHGAEWAFLFNRIADQMEIKFGASLHTKWLRYQATLADKAE